VTPTGRSIDDDPKESNVETGCSSGEKTQKQVNEQLQSTKNQQRTISEIQVAIGNTNIIIIHPYYND
jgi:hypothetical protein